MIPRTYCKTAGTAAADAELPIDYQGALARFDRTLGGMHRAPDTRRLYVGAVRRWLLAGGAPGHIEERRLSEFLAHLRQRCAVATVNLQIKALRAFYRLQADLGEAPTGEHSKLPRLRRPPERVVRFLTPEQVGEVLGTLPLNTFAGIRDYAIIRTLFETGLRAGEMARLELGCVLDDGSLFVRGKGGRDRYAPLSVELHGVIEGYIHARGLVRPGKLSTLWLARSGRGLVNGRSIWEIVHRRIWQALGKRAGWHAVQRVGRPWQGHYPHELRASFATALLRNGCPITAIAQLLGHADVSTTALYLGVDLNQLRAAMAHHPRAKRQPLTLVALHAAGASTDDTPTNPAGPPASP